MESESDELSPLHFPPGVCDLIFQHLSGNELLVTSEASPSFYNFIADSRRCMSKIKIKLVKMTMPGEVQQLLVESGRRYENIEVGIFSSIVKPAIEILSMSERKWKHVVIRCIDFATVADAVDFLGLFESTVEELLLDQVFVKSMFRRMDTGNLKFQNLKILETKCCQSLLFHEAFHDCKSLISFSIKSGSEISTSSLKAIRKILQSNAGLKILGVHFSIFNLIFSEDVTTSVVRFNLTEYHAHNLYRLLSGYCSLSFAQLSQVLSNEHP